MNERNERIIKEEEFKVKYNIDDKVLKDMINKINLCKSKGEILDAILSSSLSIEQKLNLTIITGIFIGSKNVDFLKDNI